jgi:hypothetical protein
LEGGRTGVSDDPTPDDLGIRSPRQDRPEAAPGARAAVGEPAGSQPAGAGQPRDAECQKADWLTETVELPLPLADLSQPLADPPLAQPEPATTGDPTTSYLTTNATPDLATSYLTTNATPDLATSYLTTNTTPDLATSYLTTATTGYEATGYEATGYELTSYEVTADLAGEATGDLGTGDVATGDRPAEPTGDRLRRWGREYGGYLAAGVLALVVLICSVSALDQAGVTWHSGDPLAASPPSSAAESPSPDASPSPSAASPSPTPSRRPAKRTAPKPASRPSAARSSATPRPRLLGPSDGAALVAMVDDYCDRRFDRSAGLRRPWPDSGAVDNWVCQHRRQRDPIPVNMTDACALRYGSNAVARYLDAKDPFSWRCFR